MSKLRDPIGTTISCLVGVGGVTEGYPVMYDAAGSVIESTAITDQCIGVAQADAAAGAYVQVAVAGCISDAICAEILTAGTNTKLMPDAAGYKIAAGATAQVCAVWLPNPNHVLTVVGDVIRVLITSPTTL